MSLKFGTSGVRGLVSEMTDFECWLFTRAFIHHLRANDRVHRVGISGDLRSSTPRILGAVHQALQQEDIETIYCGRVPTPTLCLYGLSQKIPTIMVTGSHIPDDRNGIKFNLPTGEILKRDEAGILAHYDQLGDGDALNTDHLFDADGRMLCARPELPEVAVAAADNYRRRYLEFFPARSLSGLRIGVYQHSSVGRDLLCELLEALGAAAQSLGRSDNFVAVDTEAVQEPERLRDWVERFGLDGLVSADGDADRPLLVDERGGILHGDLLGTLVSDYLGAKAVVLPVSCNTVVERWGRFESVRRTRIGSPHVIRGMLEAVGEGFDRVVGFEANGGFLVATPFPAPEGGYTLSPLPTRDAALPLLAILHMARQKGLRLSELRKMLPGRFTFSGLLRRFPQESGRAIVETVRQEGVPMLQNLFQSELGNVAEVDFTDGARITFAGGDVVHFRPSGNAPEFRCYTEADSEERARSINSLAMQVVTRNLRPKVEQ